MNTCNTCGTDLATRVIGKPAKIGDVGNSGFVLGLLIVGCLGAFFGHYAAKHPGALSKTARSVVPTWQKG